MPFLARRLQITFGDCTRFRPFPALVIVFSHRELAQNQAQTFGHSCDEHAAPAIKRCPACEIERVAWVRNIGDECVAFHDVDDGGLAGVSLVLLG